MCVHTCQLSHDLCMPCPGWIHGLRHELFLATLQPVQTKPVCISIAPMCTVHSFCNENIQTNVRCRTHVATQSTPHVFTLFQAYGLPCGCLPNLLLLLLVLVLLLLRLQVLLHVLLRLSGSRGCHLDIASKQRSHNFVPRPSPSHGRFTFDRYALLFFT